MAKQTQFQSFLLLFLDMPDGVSEKDFVETGKSRATWFRYLDQAKHNGVELTKGEDKKFCPPNMQQFRKQIKGIVSTSDFIQPTLTRKIAADVIPGLKALSLELQAELNYTDVFDQAQQLIESHELKYYKYFKKEYTLKESDFSKQFVKILTELQIKHGALLQSIQDVKGMVRNWLQSLKTAMHQNRFVYIKYIKKSTLELENQKVLIVDISTYSGGYLKFILPDESLDEVQSILLEDVTYIDVTQEVVEYRYEKQFNHSEKTSPSFHYQSPLKKEEKPLDDSVVKGVIQQLTYNSVVGNSIGVTEAHFSTIELKFSPVVWSKFRLETWPYHISDQESKDGSGVRQLYRLEPDLLAKIKPYRAGIEVLSGSVLWE